MPSNNVFHYSKIRTRKRSAKKSIKTGKKNGIQLFLESGIHCAGIRNPVPGIRNPPHGIQNPRLPRIPLHGASWNLISCLCFLYLYNQPKRHASQMNLPAKMAHAQRWTGSAIIMTIVGTTPMRLTALLPAQKVKASLHLWRNTVIGTSQIIWRSGALRTSRKLFNNYSLSPNGLLTQRPWGREE